MNLTYLSSSAVPASSVRDAVAWCREAGFSNLELTSSFRWSPTAEADVREAQRGGMRLLLHNYFPPPKDPFVINLASDDREIRRRSIEHCRKCLTLSGEIGADYYSVHAGFARNLRPADLGGASVVQGSGSLQEALLRFADAVSGLADTADAAGVDLLLENNVLPTRHLVAGRNQWVLAAGADDIEALFSTCAHDRVGLLLDLGHLNVSARALGADPVNSLSQVRRWTRALHLSDNDGISDTNQVFDEHTWFIRELGPFASLPWVVETNPASLEALQRCVSILATARHSTSPAASH